MDEDELSALENMAKEGEHISPENVLALIANYRLYWYEKICRTWFVH